jgi:hypothetical protein
VSQARGRLRRCSIQAQKEKGKGPIYEVGVLVQHGQRHGSCERLMGNSEYTATSTGNPIVMSQRQLHVETKRPFGL